MFNEVLSYTILVVLIVHQSTKSDARPAPSKGDPTKVPPCGDECKFNFLGEKCKPATSNIKRFPSYRNRPNHGAARCLKTVICGALIFSTKIINHLDATKPGNPCNVEWGSVPVRQYLRLPVITKPVLPSASYTTSDPPQLQRNKLRRNQASAQ